ncbi:transferrin receptor 1b [Sphaeramia orbicularis]|uniref:Transferrin receptor protein 1-like n=1 Tax=Sphaeramia orbicularis TaxID=375764 RepID=A0A672YSV6_9TELE|nr:transferrin receptor protein 1-like [Sphaeramia orbicularis]XP_029978698.1 transferrin receptor protein 1-like [Sphaeramia orbicularis]
MNRVRKTFNSLINNERYSRFTLQPEQDGEGRVEVKLSDDATDEGLEVEGQAGGSPTFRPAPQNLSRRNTCYLVLSILLIFLIGYLVGFVSHRKPRAEPVTCPPPVENIPITAPAPETPLNWKDITHLLASKLTSQAFDETLKTFDLPKRSAGSDEDRSLGNHIFDQFKKLEMEPWTDIHYVQLQTPDSSRPNHVIFDGNDFKPPGYLAYSATGEVQGKLVYGNFGRPEDLDVLQNKNIQLQGCVLLLRAGRISFAQQVDNAESRGVSAVLIYPDVEDHTYVADTPLYGHVHLGTGDPYTPGFPSFNHTQFPPTNSSGLPKIPAQTITASMAQVILQKIGGPEADASSGFRGGHSSLAYTLGGVKNITVEVNNVLVTKEIHNVFGVIKGFTDPDRYVVLGAQRDAWGKGYARAAVGTSALIELAKAFHEMVEKDGFRPRRSLVFASWSAGVYGSVGATEWLEAYLSSLDRNVLTYISLDGMVLGRGSFVASASPLLHSLLQSTMTEVRSPLGSGTIYDMVGKDKWQTTVLKPMAMDDPAYPFLAFSGIPSISFHFVSDNSKEYMYYNTNLDNMDHLDYQTNHHTSEMMTVAAQFAGQMALRLVHDHLIKLDVTAYSGLITKNVVRVYRRVFDLTQSGDLKGVSSNWLNRALGSFKRAAERIRYAVQNTDISDQEACRLLNDRLMKVEHSLLSPYVSPIETPFRHLLLGHGPHTLAAIAKTTDMKELHTQLALATWTLQGCANTMDRDIWDIDNEI